MIEKIRAKEDKLILIDNMIYDDFKKYIEFERLEKHKATFKGCYRVEEKEHGENERSKMDEDCPPEAVKFLKKRNMEVIPMNDEEKPSELKGMSDSIDKLREEVEKLRISTEKIAGEIDKCFA